MSDIVWRRGDFQLFRVVTPDIRLGGKEHRVLIHGDTVEFDGQTVRYGGEEFAFPQLKSVITRDQWLVPADEDEDFDEAPRQTRPSDTQVQRAYHEDQEVSTMEQWNTRRKEADDSAEERRKKRLAALKDGRTEDVAPKPKSKRQPPQRHDSVHEDEDGDGRTVQAGKFKGKVVGELEEQEGTPVAQLSKPRKTINMSKDIRKLAKEIAPERPQRLVKAQEEPVVRRTIRDSRKEEDVSYMRESDSLHALLGDDSEVVGKVGQTDSVRSYQRGEVPKAEVAQAPKPRRKIEVVNDEDSEPIQWDMKQPWKTRVKQLLEWYEKDIQVFEDILDVEKDAVRKHVLLALEKQEASQSA